MNLKNPVLSDCSLIKFKFFMGVACAFALLSCSAQKSKVNGKETEGTAEDLKTKDVKSGNGKHPTAKSTDADPTLEAKPQGGKSSSPATWGGRVPVEGEVILVPKGSTVVIDSPLPRLGGMRIEGTVRFADVDHDLRTGFLFVNSGVLEAGTAEKPFTKSLRITLEGKPLDGKAESEGFGSKALMVMDGVLDLHGQPTIRSWTRLGADALPGAKELILAEDAGWKVGDRLVVATSSKKMEEYDLVDVAAVSGKKITLKSPLRFKHFGKVREFDNVAIDVRAEVGRLNRNIVIRGDESSQQDKFGGHTMIMASTGVKARVSNVEFTAMGQFNRDGRYPFHFHLVGPNCQECYIKDSSVHDTVQRGIVVHDTSKVLVQDNVIFNTVGHNVIVETESTSGNKFHRNLALVNKSPTPKFTNALLKTQSDEIPGNYWVKNVANTFTENSAAGSVGIGFFFESAAGSPMIFQKNVQHAAMAKGEERDFNIQPGVFLECQEDGQPITAKITDLTTYHNGQAGFWPEMCQNFGSNSANTFEVSRIIGAENTAAEYQFRGVGDGYTIKDGVMIGSLDPARKATHPAVHIQYGSEITLESPTFVNYGGPVLAANDILSPFQARYRIRDARFLNSSSDADTPPGDNFMVEALDGSFQPLGTYISPLHRTLTVGSCTELAPGIEGTLHCPQFSRGTFLHVRKGDKNPREDGETLGGGASLHMSSNIRRASDGAVGLATPSVGFGGFSVATAPGLIYEVVNAQSGRLSIGLDPIMGPGKGVDTTSMVEVTVKVGAPSKVYRTRPNTDGELPGPLPPAAANALPKASSLAAFRSAMDKSYFYDSGTGKLHVGASAHWILAEP
jgi:hypothetical protein